MSRPNVFGDEAWDRTAEKMRMRVLAISTVAIPGVVLYPELGTFGVATRDPFAPVPEGGHAGSLGLFDLPPET